MRRSRCGSIIDFVVRRHPGDRKVSRSNVCRQHGLVQSVIARVSSVQRHSYIDKDWLVRSHVRVCKRTDRPLGEQSHVVSAAHTTQSGGVEIQSRRFRSIINLIVGCHAQHNNSGLRNRQAQSRAARVSGAIRCGQRDIEMTDTSGFARNEARRKRESKGQADCVETDRRTGGRDGISEGTSVRGGGGQAAGNDRAV